jgi:RHS repeat-associated protein
MPTTTFRTVNGRILGHNKAGVASEYLLDPLGSVIGTSTSSGVVSNRTTYWPYGEVRTGGVYSVTPFGFCGGWGYYTDSSGSLYVRARYYRPSLTRWQTVDPLWPDEMAYGYVGATPSLFADPSGLKPQVIPSACIGLLCANVDALLKALDFFGGVKGVPAGAKALAKDLIKDAAKDELKSWFCPDTEDCIKDAKKKNPTSPLGILVKHLCSQLKDNKKNCRFCVAIHGDDDRACNQCCADNFSTNAVLEGKCRDYCTGGR